MNADIVEGLKKQKVAHIKCHNSLLFHTRYFFKKRFKKKFVVNHHHEKICNILERVMRGEITRLIINMPPRYGKTEIAVKQFIPHCLSLNPSALFMHLSGSQDLALDNSEEARDTIDSVEYQELFPEVKIKKDSTAKKKVVYYSRRRYVCHICGWSGSGIWSWGSRQGR